MIFLWILVAAGVGILLSILVAVAILIPRRPTATVPHPEENDPAPGIPSNPIASANHAGASAQDSARAEPSVPLTRFGSTKRKKVLAQNEVDANAQLWAGLLCLFLVVLLVLLKWNPLFSWILVIPALAAGIRFIVATIRLLLRRIMTGI